jgi:sugar/nucleoside kinase (ribokinase family)
MTAEGPTAIPAFPTRGVKDPTGAGDSFAGGMLGYLASIGDFSTPVLRSALVRGTVAASFAIEAFSLDRVLQITRRDVDERVEFFTKMMRID